MSIEDLLKQREEIDAAIAAAKEAERPAMLAKVRSLITEFKITNLELKGVLKTRKRKVAVKPADGSVGSKPAKKPAAKKPAAK